MVLSSLPRSALVIVWLAPIFDRLFQCNLEMIYKCQDSDIGLVDNAVDQITRHAGFEPMPCTISQTFAA